MDLTTLLAAVVLLVVALSGYLLFNEVPKLDPGKGQRKSPRR